MIVLVLLCARNARAETTYDSLWLDATKDPQCVQQQYPDFILVDCREKLTFWYFSKPNHPAHPGVIKRIIEQQPDGAWVAHEDGKSFGPDSVQPAFVAWLAQIADLDRQMREYLERKQEQ